MSFHINESNQLRKLWDVEVGASIYCRPTILPGEKACVAVTTAGDVVVARLCDGSIIERHGVNAEIWSKPKILGKEHVVKSSH